jgi:hypothetical protein
VRLLVCGVDGDGRSCIVSQNEIGFSPVPGVPGTGVAKLFTTDQSPPAGCPQGLGKFSGAALPPGHVSWYIIDHKPHDGPREHAGTEMHYRNAIDMILVLEGSGEMMLADASHPIQAGDCIVMPGSDHGLRAGAQGCRLMSFAIGTPPSA